MFTSVRHDEQSIFLHYIYDSCDHIITDTCNFIVIHTPFNGTLLVIDHFISLTLVIWIQYITSMFSWYPYIGCTISRSNQYTNIVLLIILNIVPFSCLPAKHIFWILGWLHTLCPQNHLPVLTIQTYILACHCLGRHLKFQKIPLRDPKTCISLIGIVMPPLIPQVQSLILFWYLLIYNTMCTCSSFIFFALFLFN